MKKRLSFFMALLMAMLFVLSGCVMGDYNNKQPLRDSEGKIRSGEFYSLQEAYDYKYITKMELEKIAEKVNQVESTLMLGAQMGDVIIEDIIRRAERNNTPMSEAAIDGIKITYYGAYSNCYVILIENTRVFEPSGPVDVWYAIDGVQFHKTKPQDVEIWRQPGI